jgi:hypothetical protein
MLITHILVTQFTTRILQVATLSVSKLKLAHTSLHSKRVGSLPPVGLFLDTW